MVREENRPPTKRTLISYMFGEQGRLKRLSGGRKAFYPNYDADLMRHIVDASIPAEHSGVNGGEHALMMIWCETDRFPAAACSIGGI